MPVNISSLFSAVNEAAPVNNKETQSAQNTVNTSQTQNPTENIKSTSDDAGITLLKNMLKGDTFSGQIINVDDKNALLQLADGSMVNARLSAAAGKIAVGQFQTFMVEGQNKGNITIKPLGMSEQENVLISKALEAAGLMENDENAGLVKTLLSLNMPVDAKTLGELAKASLEFPDTSQTTLANLMRLEIPVTQENIAQFESYKSYEHSVLSDINTLGAGFLTMFDSMLTDENEVSLGQTASAFENLTDILYNENEITSSNITEAFDKDTINNLKDIIKEAASDTDLSEQLNKLMSKLENDSASVHDVINGLTDMIKNNKNGASALKNMGNDFFNRLISEMTDETLKLNPADVANPDGIKNYYKRIKNVMEKMSEDTKLSDKADDISKSMESIKSNIDFMNDLNKNMSYFQMPLRFSESDANGELYVFTNKKALAQGSDNVSALLHLDMENLGPVDVFVRLNKKHVSTNFCLESEELLDFVYSNIDKLNARLEALGYNTTFEMKLNSEEKDFDFVNDFVDRDIPKNKTSQYVFDVKA